MTGDMAGQYGGYDGPCPPWNDERAHRYTFKVYALDVPSLNLSGAFTGPEAEAAMQGHVLAEGEAVGLYTLNPDLR
jgi:Raf kinase inhibitor-like YbhB/YbcL family protein